MAARDNANPIVLINGQCPRWYGSRACGGQHVSIFGRSKIDTARDSFAATLQPSDHGRDLIVVASHWDRDEFPALVRALSGQYRVIRNGESIQCNVAQVLPTLEGMGSYHAVKANLNQGQTLLLEIGYGTAEVWLIDAAGDVVDGRPVDALGISALVKAIAADPTVRGLVQDESGTVNKTFISAGLQQPTLGKIGEANWTAIKAKYAGEFLKTLQGHVKTEYGDDLQTINNLVLTGGGAALLKAIQPKVGSVFVIPDRPQTASVRGSYDHQMSRV
jgi:hypothetical protein